MPPRRQSPDLGRFFTFGGRIPASIGGLLVAILVATVAGWQSDALLAAAAFQPAGVVAGQLWRLVSWFFVQPGPLDPLWIGLMLWWLAPQLLWEWGERRFLLRLVGITAGASLATTAIALVWAPAAQPHLGAWPVVGALVVAWGLLHPNAQVNFWGVFPLTGKILAIGWVGATVLYALSRGTGGFGGFMLHFTAMGIAFALSRGLSPGRWLRDAQRRMQERDARRRAKHLKVIRRNGEDDRSRWMN